MKVTPQPRGSRGEYSIRLLDGSRKRPGLIHTEGGRNALTPLAMDTDNLMKSGQTGTDASTP